MLRAVKKISPWRYVNIIMSTQRTACMHFCICQYFFYYNMCIMIFLNPLAPFDKPSKYLTIKWCKENKQVTQLAIWIKVSNFHHYDCQKPIVLISTSTICSLHISRFGIQREKAGLWLAIQCNGTMRNQVM